MIAGRSVLPRVRAGIQAEYDAGGLWVMREGVELSEVCAAQMADRGDVLDNRGLGSGSLASAGLLVLAFLVVVETGPGDLSGRSSCRPARRELNRRMRRDAVKRVTRPRLARTGWVRGTTFYVAPGSLDC
jgi:hypothetical protein